MIATHFLFSSTEYIHSQPSPRCTNDEHHHHHHHHPSNLSRTNSRNSHVDSQNLERSHGNIFDYYNKFSRDSGTSSPQPTNESTKTNLFLVDNHHQLHRQPSRSSSTKISVNNIEVIDNGEESDSTDSVFSSGSSDDLNMLDMTTMGGNGCGASEIRDIYLGGSCLLRTKWRQEFAIPYLKEHGISYYLPHLHESISNKSFLYNTPGATITNNMSSTSDNTTLPHSEKRLKYNNTNEYVNERNPDDTTTDISHDIENSDHHHQHQNNRHQNHHHHPFNVNDDGNVVDEDYDGGQNNKNYNLRLSNVNALSEEESPIFGEKLLFNPNLLDSSRVLFFLITNETRSLAPMTLAAHYIGLGYNVVLCVQMLPENCKIGKDNVSIEFYV